MDERLRRLENDAMRRASTLNIPLCRTMGVPDHFLQVWEHGTPLEGHILAPSYDIPDYPSVREQPHIAALEIDRLTEEGRIYWYEDDCPADLDICPSTLIVKLERSRLVHDWTRAGLNEFLVNPPTAYDTIDTLISCLRPNGFIAGLDIKDCFLHWPVDADS